MKKISFIVTLFVTMSMYAQTAVDLSYYLPKDVTYNPAIPTPQSVIGHEVGEWHVTHDKLIQYMLTLADASDRISITNRGATFEGRPLYLLTVTSPENHKRIDEIQQQHMLLTDSEASASLDVSSMPVVIYQGYSIHGNEPSGANSSMVYAYYLAAAQGEAIEKQLQQTVILLDPSFNPDGLQRFAYWANTNRSEHLNSDPNDREFHEVWPGGRTNHYWFDMNRDWLPVQLPESRVRIKTFTSWMPNILTDHHEMGSNSTFFFQPGIQTRVHPLTPRENQQLTKEVALFHAKALDKIGSLYYTEENYDDFYYGKGSTYPDINGGVGILFEQGSSRGHVQQTDNGELTFPFTIRNQFTTSLSTLEAANTMREKLLDYQRRFYSDVAKESAKDPIKGYVFGDAKDQAKTNALAEILQRHQIELYTPSSSFTSNGTYFDKEASYIVPTNQKKYKIIKAIFNTQTSFQDSLFYDISAWTFPLAFNLDYQPMNKLTNVGDKVTQLTSTKGSVSAKSSYAYVFEWNEYYTPKALHKILQQNLRVKVGYKPFTLEGKTYDYGTLLIPVQQQVMDEEQLYTFLQDVAKDAQIDIMGVQTGLTDGIDLGSGQFRPVTKVKVAMLVGNGVTSYDAGEIWHLFDQRYEMNLTKIDTDYLRRVDLSDYTTLIIPNGNLQFSETEMAKLKEWVQQGGVLIGYKNTVSWLARNKFIALDFEKVTVKATNVSYEQRRDFSGAQVIGGSIFNTKLDRSHPIAFGYKNDELAMFRRTKVFMKPDEASFNNPITYTTNPLLSGYISEPNLKVLRNTVPFQIKSMGSGKVAVFTDNTNFRAFWYGTNKLLMNVVFFGKEM